MTYPEWNILKLCVFLQINLFVFVTCLRKRKPEKREFYKEERLKEDGRKILKHKTIPKEKLNLKKIITVKVKPTEEKATVHLKKANELYRHLDNIRLLLLYSNATPIRCYAGVGFKCSFCPDQYQKPEDLKQHTLNAHDEQSKSSYMERATMVRYIVKLDVTWLRCTICGSHMKNIEDLTEHLVSKHDKTYYFDIKNHIIPFKFETEHLKCAICEQDFNNFKVLMEHMNVHFKNHVCEVCGCGFINKHTLQCHSYRHRTGVFNCSHCPKIFDTKIKKRDHERSVHVKASKTNKCAYCGEKFSDYRKKKDHEVKQHGAMPLVLKCQACEETFNDQTLLTVHTKSYHLMERRLPR